MQSMLNEITRTTDEASVCSTLENIVRAFNSSNVEELLALHTDDFVLMDSGKPIKYGKGIAHETFDRFKREGISFQLRYSIDELEVHGELAFVRGEVISRLAKGDAPPMHNKGRFLCLFRKQRSGAWLRSHVMTNKADDGSFN